MIQPFLLPPTLIFVGMAVSYFLISRKHKLGKILLLFTLTFYYLLSIEPVAYLIANSLVSTTYAKNIEAEVENVEAIVVLAGGVSKWGGATTYILGTSSLRRLKHGIKLHEEFKDKIPMLYSGGSGDPFDPVSVETELAKKYAISAGVPEKSFWTESSSRNTYENGIGLNEVLDKQHPGIEHHKIILVTSLLHMRRSVAVMKKIGLDVIPSPTRSSIGPLNLDPLSFFPSIGNFGRSTYSIREWVGICGYWARGWI